MVDQLPTEIWFVRILRNSAKILIIYDMAKHLIALSGLEVDKDIQIKIIGLRPGEKLYEELWNKEERPIPTEHPKILKSSQVSVNGHLSKHSFRNLKKLALRNDRQGIFELLAEMVPTARFEKVGRNVEC